MTLQEVFNNFILSRKLSGLSEKTVKAYYDFVFAFVEFVGTDLDFKCLSQEHINNYILFLLDKPISKASLSTYIRHVKVFLRWASECESDVNYNYKSVKVPKMPKRERHIYSDDEIRIIFRMIENDIDWIRFRNCAIVSLMLDSGLRQKEVCGLFRRNLSFSEKRLLVLGKGNKERIVPMGNLTSSFLRDYLELCPFNSKFVFLSLHGEPLTCNAVKLMIGKLSKKLPFEFSSHKLRHNFATNYCLNQYYKNGQIDIYHLMALMGHENLETTNRYLHFAYEVIASRNCISHIDNIFNKTD